MGFADRTALAIPPIFLRIALAIIFLQAGLGKVLTTSQVQGEGAAALANMGLAIPPSTAPAAPRAPATPAPAIPAPATPNAAPVIDGEDEPVIEGDGEGEVQGSLPGAGVPSIVRVQSASGPLYVPSDFPEPVEVRSLYNLALMINTAANPPVAEDGTVPPPIWPAWASTGPWPIVLAWTASITELLAGLFLLIGFLTRISGLAVAWIMLVAIWLTQCGPAMQGGTAFLGFLPTHGLLDGMAWQKFMYQFLILCAGLALVFGGSGALALDALGRKRRHRDDEDHE